jgi:hypothetical protein
VDIQQSVIGCVPFGSRSLPCVLVQLPLVAVEITVADDEALKFFEEASRAPVTASCDFWDKAWAGDEEIDGYLAGSNQIHLGGLEERDFQKALKALREVICDSRSTELLMRALNREGAGRQCIDTALLKDTLMVETRLSNRVRRGDF